MANKQRARTVYSIGEAIRLQRETLRFCSAMFGETYLPTDSRESLRREIDRVLRLTSEATQPLTSDATARMARIMGCEFVVRDDQETGESK